jgi:hypothetical protein
MPKVEVTRRSKRQAGDEDETRRLDELARSRVAHEQPEDKHYFRTKSLRDLERGSPRLKPKGLVFQTYRELSEQLEANGILSDTLNQIGKFVIILVDNMAANWQRCECSPALKP